ncbi:hypothetical protein D3C71_1314420 [compost metagenome]
MVSAVRPLLKKLIQSADCIPDLQLLRPRRHNFRDCSLHFIYYLNARYVLKEIAKVCDQEVFLRTYESKRHPLKCKPSAYLRFKKILFILRMRVVTIAKNSMTEQIIVVWDQKAANCLV